MSLGYPTHVDAIAASTLSPPAAYQLDDCSWAAAVRGRPVALGGGLHYGELAEGSVVKLERANPLQWRVVCGVDEPDVRCWYEQDDWSGLPCREQAVAVLVRDERRSAIGTAGRRAACSTHAYRREWQSDRVEPIIRDPLPIALLCGAIAGSWSDAQVALLEQWMTGDDAAREVLLTDAEQRGLHRGGWPAPRRDWPRVDKHGTGNNPHVWLKWRSGDRARATSACVIPGDLDWIMRCPCGLFEHENVAVRVPSGSHL